jgi:hypothetical protein
VQDQLESILRNLARKGERVIQAWDGSSSSSTGNLDAQQVIQRRLLAFPGAFRTLTSFTIRESNLKGAWRSGIGVEVEGHQPS